MFLLLIRFMRQALVEKEGWGTCRRIQAACSGGEDRDEDVGDKPSCGRVLSGIQLRALGVCSSSCRKDCLSFFSSTAQNGRAGNSSSSLLVRDPAAPASWGSRSLPGLFLPENFLLFLPMRGKARVRDSQNLPLQASQTSTLKPRIFSPGESELF